MAVFSPDFYRLTHQTDLCGDDTPAFRQTYPALLLTPVRSLPSRVNSVLQTAKSLPKVVITVLRSWRCKLLKLWRCLLAAFLAFESSACR